MSDNISIIMSESLSVCAEWAGVTGTLSEAKENEPQIFI